MRRCKVCGARVPDKTKHSCPRSGRVFDSDDDNFFTVVVDAIADVVSNRSHHHSHGSSLGEFIADVLDGDAFDD